MHVRQLPPKRANMVCAKRGHRWGVEAHSIDGMARRAYSKRKCAVCGIVETTEVEPDSCRRHSVGGL